MRTKITILSAVALAAGLFTSHAQVFSANVVGYYNVVSPLGNPGSSKKHLISNQLKGGQGGTNGISDVLVAGLGDVNSQKVNLLKWNGAGFTTYTYFGPTDAGNATGLWADGGGNPVNVPLNQGEAAFLENASGVALTNTIVGEVVQGPFAKTITVGKAPYSIVPPISTNLLAPYVLLAFGDALSQKVNLLHWNLGLQKFDGALTYYGPTDAGNATGVWADGGGTDQTANAAYFPTVGEGFFIDNGAPAYTWTSSFTVQ
jgi:hypothetical protein